jgi:hypothetical protein
LKSNDKISIPDFSNESPWFLWKFFFPCKTPTLLPQQMHLPVSSTPQKLTQEKGIFTVGRKICAKSGKAKGFHH